MTQCACVSVQTSHTSALLFNLLNVDSYLCLSVFCLPFCLPLGQSRRENMFPDFYYVILFSKLLLFVVGFVV